MYQTYKISEKEYTYLLNQFTGNSPFLFQQANCIKFYENVEFLKVNNGKKDVCVYAYPVFKRENRTCLRRPFRLLPYSLPAMPSQTTKTEQKQILQNLFGFLFNCDEIYLPLFYKFDNLMAIQSKGGFLEQRGTHIAYKYHQFPSKLLKEIEKIRGKIEVVQESPDRFNFEKAIIGNDESVLKRKQFANFVFNKKQAFVLNAYDQNQNNIAGILVMYDKFYAYLFHSWRKDDALRGVVPLLIQSAMRYCFDVLNVCGFDFEGSVINSIDDFFTGFETQIESYPFIHFAKEESDFVNLINTSKNIKGRLVE